MGALFLLQGRKSLLFFLTVNPALHQRRRRKKNKQTQVCVFCNVQPRCTSERGKREPRERAMLKVFVCTGMQAETTAGVRKCTSAVNTLVSFPLRLLWHVISSSASRSSRGIIPAKGITSACLRFELAFRVSAHARTGIGGGKSEHVSVWATFPGTDSRRVHYRPK